MTDAKGEFRLEMPQIVPAFGQPHGHLAYDSGEFETVFPAACDVQFQRQDTGRAFRVATALIPVIRTGAIWATLIAALAVPLIAAAGSPYLAWRDPAYILAGFAGVLSLGLLLLQPLLAGRYLAGPVRSDEPATFTAGSA